MRNSLIIIRIYFLSRDLPAFLKRSPSLPSYLMELVQGPSIANAWLGTIAASLRSNLSLEHSDRMSTLLPTMDSGWKPSVVFQGGQDHDD